MKAQFETPEVKLLAFLPVDVITTSGLIDGGEGDGEEIPMPWSYRD